MSVEALLDQTFTAPSARCHRMTDMLRHYVAPSYPLRILDIGCGTGEQLLALAQAFPMAELLGVDISEANIARAEQARQQSPWGDRLTFVTGDYLDVPLEPFDCIVSDSTLHNIAAPTPGLCSKLATDLRPGGILVATLPYACLYNHALWTLRRFCRAFRSPVMDAVVLAVARILHRRQFAPALLQERLPYMYLVPARYLSEAFYQVLWQNGRFIQVAEQPLPHASLAQPKHRLVVFRKRG